MSHSIININNSNARLLSQYIYYCKHKYICQHYFISIIILCSYNILFVFEGHKKEERHYALPNPISASEYIEIDDSHVSDELNLNDIVTIINPPEENESQEEIIEELPPVTNKEALSD